MEKLQNLKDHICSWDNLLCAYKEAARDKRYRNEVITFSFHLEENLFDIQQDLLNQTYTVGRYREFYVHYPKARLVMALGFRDRIVQWAIYRQINPYIDKRFIQHSYGCRRGKGTLAAAQCLLNWLRLVNRKADAKNWAVIKGDISKYFYRVDHDIIMRVYAEISDDPWFLWLIGTIINNPDLPFGLPEGMSIDDCPKEKRLYDVGMPIGNLTSQETANLYLHKLDRYVKHNLRLHFYVRYMDDFIIITHRENAAAILDNISHFLRSELRLATSAKSRILPIAQPVEFVGYSISVHGLRLRRRTTRHIKRSLKHVSHMYAEGNCDLDDALHTTNSYWGLTKSCNGYGLRRWIENNIAFERKDEGKEMPEMSERPEEKLALAAAPQKTENNSEEASLASEQDSLQSIDDATWKMGPLGRTEFYALVKQEDGTVDVYLTPDAHIYSTDVGVREYDMTVRIVRGVAPWDGLESDIRARYYAWCDSAEVVNL